MLKVSRAPRTFSSLFSIADENPSPRAPVLSDGDLLKQQLQDNLLECIGNNARSGTPATKTELQRAFALVRSSYQTPGAVRWFINSPTQSSDRVRFDGSREYQAPLLYNAVHSYDIYAVRKLLEMGADPRVRCASKNKASILDGLVTKFSIEKFPEEGPRLEILKMLLENVKARCSEEHLKEFVNYVPIREFRNGREPVILDVPAVHKAAFNRQLDCVDLLVSYGADLDMKNPKYENETARDILWNLWGVAYAAVGVVPTPPGLSSGSTPAPTPLVHVHGAPPGLSAPPVLGAPPGLSSAPLVLAIEDPAGLHNRQPSLAFAPSLGDIMPWYNSKSKSKGPAATAAAAAIAVAGDLSPLSTFSFFSGE